MARRIIETAIGIFLLALAVVGAILFQQQYRNGVENHAMPVPIAEIAPYTILTEDMFEMQDFPQALFQIGKYTSSMDQLVGKISTSQIPAGVPVPLAQISSPAAFRLADPELEVLSIPITPPSAIGGRIRIGDKVNIYRLSIRADVLNDPDADPLSAANVILVAGNVPVVEVMGGDGNSAGSRANGQTISASILIVAVPPRIAIDLLKLIAETKANAILWVTLATVK
jgi:Flp pilus assembly protein CpaB